MIERAPRAAAARILVGFLLTALVAVPAVSRAQVEPPLPPARQIVDRFVAAIGGQAAYKAVKSIHARGTMAVTAQQIGGNLELFSSRPARALYRVTVAGVGRIEQGYNGTVGWTVSPVTGPELVTGRELAERADDAWFDSPLHEADRLRELTTVARVDFDGHQAYKVRVVHNSGHEQIEYFDVQTGLLIGSEADQASPQGVIHTVTVVRNYVKFGPLLQATTYIQRALGFEQTMTVTSVEYDTVPDSVFDPPAEVKALLSR
jgi:hypothetical protein